MGVLPIAWRSWRKPVVAAALVVLVVLGLPGSAFGACATGTAGFSYVGAEQCYTVPAGDGSVYVQAVGAPGAGAGVVAGGFGAVVKGYLPAAPGQTLYVEVGGAGSGSAAGFNGGGDGASGDGGGGGGASDLRTCSTTTSSCSGGGSSLDSRLVVAAGGGGAGAATTTANCTTAGGAGGSAGSVAGSGSPGANGAVTVSDGGAGGGGASGLLGGTPGSGGSGSQTSGSSGGSGAQGAGGPGGPSALPSAGGGGGGAGGGLLGGGGGGGGGLYSQSGAVPVSCEGGGGGGGAGSNLQPEFASTSTDTTGVPSVTITPLGPTASISPASGGIYTRFLGVATSFYCFYSPGGTGLSVCKDSNGVSASFFDPHGAHAAGSGQLDTSTLGSRTYSVQVQSDNGAAASASITYTVIPLRLPVPAICCRTRFSEELEVRLPGPGLVSLRQVLVGQQASPASFKRTHTRLIAPAAATVKKAGRVKLKLKLTAAGRRALKRTGELRARAIITYTAAVGTAKATRKFTVTLRRG